jgi:hypothetical protein
MSHHEILGCLDELSCYLGKVDDAMQTFDKIQSGRAVDVQHAAECFIRPAMALVSKTRPRVEKEAESVAITDTSQCFETVLITASELKGNWRWSTGGYRRKSELKNLVDPVDNSIEELLQNVAKGLLMIEGVINGKNNISAAVDIAKELHDAGSTVTDAIKDATTYPVLTQGVGYPSSPIAVPAGGGSAGLGAGLSSAALKAINDVLGWKSKPGDSKGFVGALNASFTCQEVEGRTEVTWTPRTYAVSTDLAGGITGAQASIYTRAKEALDLALPLLDGLQTLDPAADKEDVEALKKVARSQMTELVAELGVLGGPRAARVSQFFDLLLGAGSVGISGAVVEHNPDDIGGTLGSLRDLLGLKSTDDFGNSVEDEQILTNFRILADYMTALAQSWVNNLGFFTTSTKSTGGEQTPLFGTRLVLLSRQLSVIAESVDEVRFALDSVFIGPAERQTLELQLKFGQPLNESSMSVEDILSWVASFAKEEGPHVIQEGGKYAVQNAFAPQVKMLHDLVAAALDPQNKDKLPGAYYSGRVKVAWQQMAVQLEHLLYLAAPIKHDIKTKRSA